MVKTRFGTAGAPAPSPAASFLEIPSRRRLLAAGLSGAALALIRQGSATATTPPTPSPGDSGTTVAPVTEPPTTPPNQATAEDTDLLASLQRLELTARALYQAAIDAGASDEGGVIQTLRDNHAGYGNRISGLIGGAAPQAADDALFAQLAGDFETDDIQAVATAGYELESGLVATYLDALGQLEGRDGAAAAASMLIIESRHAAVLADLAGRGDELDALLVNDAEPIPMSAGSTP